MSFAGGGGLRRHQLPAPKETIVTPNMIQAVAQARMDDFVRAADRRRLAAGAAQSRRVSFSGSRSSRQRRRLRLSIA
jgi:hypothetical protein